MFGRALASIAGSACAIHLEGHQSPARECLAFKRYPLQLKSVSRFCGACFRGSLQAAAAPNKIAAQSSAQKVLSQKVLSKKFLTLRNISDREAAIVTELGEPGPQRAGFFHARISA